MSGTITEIDQLRAGMTALEAQRAILGDATVESALGPMREKLTVLEAQSQAAQQRKQATVLFADVSGFTAMSETMDAENVAGVMNDLWALVDAAIVDHGGRIDKHIGDAVMALWGADVVREDDPERAVRAALAMQAAVAAFCTTHNAPLALRIGVNTGPVVIGAVGTTGEFTALGDTVNLASRLERAAPVEGVLIGYDTYRHVHGVFDLLPQEPLVVKGKTETVQTYVVLRAKPRAFHMTTRGVEGIETRMVGRDRELGMLRDAYADAVEGNEARLITVVGEAGVGKSRLLIEFNRWLPLSPERLYRGRATLNGRSVGFGLFRDLLASRFDILDSDSTVTAREKFRAGFSNVLEPDQADIVGRWLGFNFSSSDAVARLLVDSGFGETAHRYLFRAFRALAAAEPLVFMLEDIHWADDPSLDLAAQLVQTLGEARLLIIAAARPALYEHRPNWGEGDTAFRRINLPPLSKRATRTLVEEVVQRVDDIPDSLRALITDVAEGNPFYVEELVKMLIDQGIIERTLPNPLPQGEGTRSLSIQEGFGEGDRWHVLADKLAGLKVPPTLTALLQARLDGLPRSEREVLQRASVIGRQFWDDAVADLTQTPVNALRQELAAVRQRELIFRHERSAFAHAEEYVFKHSLLRDVAYETVLLRNRPAYHTRAARWLEEHAGERSGEFAGLIAEHYQQAGDVDRAVEYLMRFGQQVVDDTNPQGARPYLERALSLLRPVTDADDPRLTLLEYWLGKANAMLGDNAPAEELLRSSLERARRSGDAAHQASALTSLAVVFFLRGNYTAAQSLIEAALPLARTSPPAILARSLYILTWMSNLYDDYITEDAIRELLSLAAQGVPKAESWALSAQVSALVERGQFAPAINALEQQLARSRQSGNLAGEEGAIVSLGWAWLCAGDAQKALAYFEPALVFEREGGSKWRTSNGLVNLALAHARLSQRAAAATYLREGLSLAAAIDAGSVLLSGVVCYAMLLAKEGRAAEAATLLGVVATHPAAVTEKPLLSLFHADLGLSDEQMAAGLAAGAAMDFDAVVREILDARW